MFEYTTTEVVRFAHTDGQVYAITFYHLQDGRGWVHDFLPSVFK